MKQIYDFEQYNPPALNTEALRAEAEQQKLNCQTALLVIAGILIQVVIAIFGYSAINWYPWVTVSCFAYIIISTTGCGFIAMAYSRKGGITV